MIKKKSLKVLTLTVAMALIFTGCSPKIEDQETNGNKENQEVAQEKQEEVELVVYAGARLKKAMEMIKPAFEAKENVEVQYIYAGSGQLLAQMETTGKGDVFIVGSEATYNMAKEKGQANESKLIAHHTPALAVQKGNPKGIKSLVI